MAPLPATVSADPLPTWQVTGVVWSQVVVGNTVYATGNFTKARPPGMWQGGPTEITVGHLIAYDITTGARVASFNHLLNAQGMTVTASPDGSRVYVGGDFTTVDGIARSHIAAFDTGTGALSQAFAPAINGQVRSVAATNTTVYAGGAFESAEGVARNRLASFAASNGAMSPAWAPTVPDGYVWSMVVAPGGSKVVIGGQFDTLNGVAVHGMGAVDAVTGASMAWAANTVIQDSINGAITSLRTDGTSVYGSGFAFGAGSSFEGTFSANPVTGAINWLNDCHGDTYDVLPLGKVVYSVSHAHDCSWIGAYPDTSPRVRWQHALATTNYATGTNKGPDNYGWNFNGQPDSTLLQWYPDLGIGTFTGQYQAAWSLAGNATYVVLGGEFPTVNGGEQQGLTRFAVTSAAPNKRGPQYTTVPARPTPATTATATTPGAVQVSFGTAWDMDNQRLTYEVIRDGQSVVYTTTADTNFWTLPNLSFTDTGLAAGSHSYQVRIKDPFNNTLLSPVSNTVTVLAGNQPPVAAFTSTAANLVASFDGSGSSDPDGTIASYAWVFGDATTGTGAKPSHTYAAAGTYSVKLTVTDNQGATSSATRGLVLATAAVPRPDHVVVVVMENHSASSVIGNAQAPYINSLANGGANMTQSFAITHPSEPNYLAMFSGSTQGLTDDSCPNTYASTNLAGQLAAKGLPFTGYSEDLPSAGFTGCFSGNYARKHNPWVNWPSVPSSANQPLTAFPTDYTQLPAVSFVIPNLQNDMHDGTIGQADTWLQNNLGAYATWAQQRNSLLVVTWDEDDNTANNKIPTIVWGQQVKTGQYPTLINHYNVLRTIQDAYGLPANDGSAAASPITNIWKGPNQPPVAAFTSTAANLVASFDGSGSSDPDGTVASYGWDFGDATTGTGAKPSHTYAAAGTYSVKLTVTDNQGASSSVTKAVTVTSGPFAKDTFARTVANGWGAADVGGSWSVSGGSANFSVANGWGKLATPAPGTGVTALLSGVSSLNTDLQLQFAMDKLPTGGGQFFWVIGRGAPSDGYRAKVWVSSNGTMVLYLSKYVGGAETELVSSVVPGVTYVPGDAYQLRLQVLGAGPTTLQAKAWKAGTSEPAAWTVTGTDSTTSLQSAGAIGFQTYLSSRATNAPLTISVGQLFARNP
ncbi:MAG: PKD domain-containing protein [Lapillicoccus sp.]